MATDTTRQPGTTADLERELASAEELLQRQGRELEEAERALVQAKEDTRKLEHRLVRAGVRQRKMGEALRRLAEQLDALGQEAIEEAQVTVNPERAGRAGGGQ